MAKQLSHFVSASDFASLSPTCLQHLFRRVQRKAHLNHLVNNIATDFPLWCFICTLGVTVTFNQTEPECNFPPASPVVWAQLEATVPWQLPFQ